MGILTYRLKRTQHVFLNAFTHLKFSIFVCKLRPGKGLIWLVLLFNSCVIKRLYNENMRFDSLRRLDMDVRLQSSHRNRKTFTCKDAILSRDQNLQIY